MNVLDLVAVVFLVGGSALIALGSIGLVTFPDVLTRMHAATKAATVGVIATTVAAVFEAGGPGGLLVLLLVIALLFLSGPLGMSLLARAAYHDPETPLAANTRELVPSLPRPETGTSTLRLGTSPMLAVWLFVAWLALFGSFAPHVVGGGVVVAGLVAYIFRHLSPRWPRALLRPRAVGRFARHFVTQLVASTWGVIVALRLRRDQIRPAVIEVPLRVRTRTEITLLMNSISFTPGTVALELHHQQLFVHVLTTNDPDAVAADVQRMEGHIMDMFGTEIRRPL
jgi:monovalent cation/proton antiporter MnhG/PhaG subunit